jgi:hypothetical protein
MSSATNIKVVARFRPQNRIELESGGQPIVRFEGPDVCSIDASVFTSVGLAICMLTLFGIVQGGARLLHLRPRVRYVEQAG